MGSRSGLGARALWNSRAAKSARCWDGLTFETKDEIIIFIERIAIFLAELTPLAFFRIHSSFIIESRLLHIRNS